jgi:hypothetical protein
MSKKTHIEVDVEDKEALIKIRDLLGYGSIRVIVKKLIAQFGDKVK